MPEARNAVPASPPEYSRTTEPAPVQLLTGTIYHVSDGDTADFQPDNGQEIRLRFYGVDAPETSQEFGGEARKYAMQRLLKKRVEVRVHNLDRYGRSVATIYLDGRDFCLEMLRGGYVWHYVQYCNDPEYAQAEAEARAAGRGLWGDAASRGEEPVPPWTYRREHPRRSRKAQ